MGVSTAIADCSGRSVLNLSPLPLVLLCRYLLSVKRTLVGQAGHLSENILINGLPDIKIGGRNNGQRSRQWH